MPVRTASVVSPTRLPIETIASASARASASDFMNAPRPTFTSKTRASVPSPIFLLMIDDAMSGRLSTVPVTSRSAYSFLSAGAMSGVWPTKAHPIANGGENSSRSQTDSESRNGFELVDGATRMSEAAARALGPWHATGGDEWNDDDRGLVANAAGLCACRPWFQDRSRDRPAVRRRPSLRSARPSPCGHAAQEHGHEQRGHLVVGQRAARHPGDDELDFGRVRAAPSRFLTITSTMRMARPV